ncbi:MAG: DUF58 domain-containing protein [Azospira sp.]|nr:DUF58 domain-containing protein [Azospira sp.]
MSGIVDGIQRRLLRSGGDERLPIVLDRRRIFVLPSAAGVTHATVLAVMLIAAINYNLGLGHALVFLLAGLGLVGMVHGFRNLAGLAIMPGRAEPVFAGDIARFPLHLANNRHEPRLALDLRFRKDRGAARVDVPVNDTVRIDVPGNGTARIDVPCAAPRRGWLVPGPLLLETRYPLGLFRVWSLPAPPLRVLVHPRPLHRPLPPPLPVVDPGSARGEAGDEDFAGLRPRQPADSPRHVAWKAVARDAADGPLPVKHFAGGGSEELWLDWALTANEGDAETRLSILAGWVLAADAAGIAYGLRLPERRLAPAHGGAHRDACLEALALH